MTWYGSRDEWIDPPARRPMPPTTLTVNQTPCQVRQVRWSHEAQPCDRCQQPADRVAEALRIAVDVDLDGPALLQIAVSVHYCAACTHYFRAQPPFLRP